MKTISILRLTFFWLTKYVRDRATCHSFDISIENTPANKYAGSGPGGNGLDTLCRNVASPPGGARGHYPFETTTPLTGFVSLDEGSQSHRIHTQYHRTQYYSAMCIYYMEYYKMITMLCGQINPNTVWNHTSDAYLYLLHVNVIWWSPARDQDRYIRVWYYNHQDQDRYIGCDIIITRTRAGK